MEQKKREKKEHSNAFNVLRLLFIFVIAIMAFLLLSGQWMPFKDQNTSDEAIYAYKNSKKDIEKIFNVLNEEIEKETGEEPEFPDIMKPGGKCAYGFYSEAYGEEGNEKGIIKQFVNGRQAFLEKYGNDLRIYYMKNEDYAKEFYNNTRNSFGSVVEEHSFENGKIAFGKYDIGGGANIVFRKDTIVYHALTSTKEEYEKASQMMELFNIDYKFPEYKTLWHGNVN